LNIIARRLKTISWQFELGEDEKRVCHELQSNPQAARKLVTLMRDYKTWMVRAYLGGGQRTFGYYSDANLEPLFRYADMVRMYFWKYKRRDAFEPGTADLNISAEQAKFDLEHETEAIQLVKDVEAHLFSIGAIMRPEEREKLLQGEVRNRRARPTLSTTLMDVNSVLQTKLEAVQGVLTAMQGQLKAVQDSQARVNTFMESLLKVAQHRPSARSLSPEATPMMEAPAPDIVRPATRCPDQARLGDHQPITV
jgi:hypothetical protein